MTLYPASIRDLLAQIARAAWTRATDHVRRDVCPACHCVHREAR